MSEAQTAPLSLANRWLVILMLMGFAALGHFNRIGIAVVGAEVLIKPSVTTQTQSATTSEKDHPEVNSANGSQHPDDNKNSKQSFYHAFSETDMGWIYTAFLVVYTCAMLPGGWLIDRIGASRALTWLGVMMGTFVMLTGVFGWVMATPQSLWMGLLMVRGFAGVCSAPLHPGAAHAIADVTAPVGRSTGNGLVTAGAVLGIALTYPLFGRLKDILTWQWAFLVSGGVLIAYGLLWRWVTRSRLPHTSLASRDEHDRTGDNATGPWSLMSHGGLWLVSLSYFAYSYYQYLMFYWMNYFFESELHVSASDARWASFWITIAQGLGMFLGGISADVLCRVMGITGGRRSIMVGGMLICAMLTVVAVMQKDLAHVTLLMSLAMGAQGMCEGIYWTTATELGGRSRGFAGAFLNTIGNVGGFISPVLTPMLAEKMGWTGALTVACAVCALGGLMWLGIDTAQPKSEAVA